MRFVMYLTGGVAGLVLGGINVMLVLWVFFDIDNVNMNAVKAPTAAVMFGWAWWLGTKLEAWWVSRQK